MTSTLIGVTSTSIEKIFRKSSQIPPALPVVFDYYLLNPKEEGERRYKPLLSQTDKASIIAIAGDSEPPKERSLRVTENFALFESLIADYKNNLAAVCRGLPLRPQLLQAGSPSCSRTVFASIKSRLSTRSLNLEYTAFKMRLASSTLLSFLQSLARLVAARSSSIVAC